jgi:hypothetical protein
MNNIPTCEYCGKTFGKPYNLYKHQRTAKYCIKVQSKDSGKEPITVTKNGDTMSPPPATRLRLDTCRYCGIEFTRVDNLKRHESVCVQQQQQPQSQSRERDPLLEMIADLQKTIVNLSEKQHGGDNSNNRIMNLPPVTDEALRKQLDKLTIEFINNGAKGYADYANYYSLRDRLLCTDKSRKKFRYKGNDGEIVNDGGGLKLAKRFFSAISQRNEEIINSEYHQLQQQVQHIAMTETGATADLTGLLNRSTELQDLLIKCRDAAEGKENDLTRDFIRHLSKLL